jgi:hypothetical protein
VLALRVAKKRREEEAEMRATDSSVRIAGGEVAASVRSAGSSADQLSDKASFKTASESWSSRSQRRTEKQRMHLQGKAEKGTLLSNAGHARRQQVAAMMRP